jgi:hypothetical protein
MNRQRLILFILGIVFVAAAAWSYKSVPRLKTVEKLTYTQGQQAKRVSTASKTGTPEMFDGRVLNIALLEQEQADFKGYRRNIFKPIFVDEQQFVKQKAAALKPPVLPPVQSQKAAPAVSTVVMPDAAALAKFTFLGFLKKDSQPTIFLAKDKDIILVKQGDRVAGRYEASSITDQSLILTVADTGNEIVIPLIENSPLKAVK